MSANLVSQITFGIGFVTTGFCLVVMAYKGLLRKLTLFGFYLVYVLVTTTIAKVVPSVLASTQIYLALTMLDYLFELGVIWELAHQIAASLKTDSYRIGRLMAMIALIFGVPVVISVSVSSHFQAFETEAERLLIIDTVFRVARIFILSVLLTVSYALRASWKHPAVKLATLLSLYSAVSLAVRALEQFGDMSPSIQVWFPIAEMFPVLIWWISMVVFGLQLLSYAGQTEKASAKPGVVEPRSPERLEVGVLR